MTQGYWCIQATTMCHTSYIHSSGMTRSLWAGAVDDRKDKYSTPTGNCLLKEACSYPLPRDGSVQWGPPQWERGKVRLCSDWQKDRLHPISYSFQKELSTLSTFSWAADWHVSSGQSLQLKFHSVYVIMKNKLQIMTSFINLFHPVLHKVMMVQVQCSLNRIWCNSSRLLSAFCVSIVGHGRSPFLFEGVSHPMG